MLCPYCNAQTQVSNSRSHNNGFGVWRRRRCKSCSAEWTTAEKYELKSTHRIQHDSEKRLEALNRDILFLSVRDSLQHRKTATNDASALTDTIISKLLSLKEPIIHSAEIKTTVLTTLQSFDKTAAAVYAAKHPL